jgi:hypothetical protein
MNPTLHEKSFGTETKRRCGLDGDRRNTRVGDKPWLVIGGLGLAAPTQPTGCSRTWGARLPANFFGARVLERLHRQPRGRSQAMLSSGTRFTPSCGTNGRDCAIGSHARPHVYPPATRGAVGGRTQRPRFVRRQAWCPAWRADRLRRAQPRPGFEPSPACCLPPRQRPNSWFFWRRNPTHCRQRPQ